MLRSMTGFATQSGSSGGFDWTWDLRSVNARGLDLRLRVPDWIPGLEQALRKTLGGELGRGSVNLSLRVTRSEDAVTTLNAEALDNALLTLGQIAHRAAELDVPLSPSSHVEILGLRGLADQQDVSSEELEALRVALVSDLGVLITSFQEARAGEGAALQKILTEQLDTVLSLVGQSATAAEARRPKQAEMLNRNLQKVLDATDAADPQRIAQELAILTVKSDVTEEIDRLRAHAEAARELLQADGPVGRKLDFLSQEFNREANTLCSKSGDPDLTRIGLDLKAVIDQMREQVQNVE